MKRNLFENRFFDYFRSSKTSNRTRNAQARSLRLESLEDRQLLSATPYENFTDYGKDVAVQTASVLASDIVAPLYVEDDAATPTIELSTNDPVWGYNVVATLNPSNVEATYQWYSGSDEAGWTAINGATHRYFNPSFVHIGKSLKVEATYTDVEGSDVTVSAQTDIAKFNVAGVSIDESAPLFVDSSVSATIVSRYATAEYQWYRVDADGAETLIDDATDASYTPNFDDVGCYLKVVATGVGNSLGTFEVTSAQTVDYVATLTVSEYDPLVGARVEAALTPSVDATYQWYANGEAISGATSTSFTAPFSMAGKTLSVTAVTFDGKEVSADAGIISRKLTNITIDNFVPVVGVSLFTYTTPVTRSISTQWYRVDAEGVETAIDGATNVRYTPTTEDVGYYLKVVAEGKDGFKGTVEKTTSVAVLETSPLSLSSETAEVGVPLDSILTPADPTATYQWYRLTDEGWEWIEDATDSSYTPTKKNVGDVLRVSATYGEGEYAGLRAVAVSSAVAPTLELSTNDPIWGYNVVATLNPSNVEATYQWYSGSDEDGWTAISGATHRYFSPSLVHIGKYLKVEATCTNGAVAGMTVSAQTDTAKFNVAGVSINEVEPLVVDSVLTTSIVSRYATAEYQWYRVDADGAETLIDGATGSSYTTVVEDAGCYLKVVATGVENSFGTFEATSRQSVEVPEDASNASLDVFEEFEETLDVIAQSLL